MRVGHLLFSVAVVAARVAKQSVGQGVKGAGAALQQKDFIGAPVTAEQERRALVSEVSGELHLKPRGEGALLDDKLRFSLYPINKKMTMRINNVPFVLPDFNDEACDVTAKINDDQSISVKVTYRIDKTTPEYRASNLKGTGSLVVPFIEENGKWVTTGNSAFTFTPDIRERYNWN